MKEYGQDLNLGGTSDLNAWKMRIEAQTNAEPKEPEFKPLRSFPAKPDPRQAEREFYASLPSRYA